MSTRPGQRERGRVSHARVWERRGMERNRGRGAIEEKAVRRVGGQTAGRARRRLGRERRRRGTERPGTQGRQRGDGGKDMEATVSFTRDARSARESQEKCWPGE